MYVQGRTLLHVRRKVKCDLFTFSVLLGLVRLTVPHVLVRAFLVSHLFSNTLIFPGWLLHHLSLHRLCHSMRPPPPLNTSSLHLASAPLTPFPLLSRITHRPRQAFLFDDGCQRMSDEDGIIAWFLVGGGRGHTFLVFVQSPVMFVSAN